MIIYFFLFFINCLCIYFLQDGGVFTCGAGMYGQLGHGSFSNEIIPRKVIELMGSTVTQVTCGRYVFNLLKFVFIQLKLFL